MNNNKSGKSRRWVFTLNNYTTREYNWIKAQPCKWMIVAKECGENGTLHLQGAVVCNNPKTLSAMKKFLGGRCHYEIMRGTPADSRKYCSKQDPNPFEKGDIPRPGKRNDLIAACQELKEGKSIIELAQEETHGPVIVKYYKGLQQYKSLIQANETREKPTVYWLYGPTGTGKTREAVNLGMKAESYWMSNGDLKWFDGYEGQKVAIFDDLRHKHCTFDYLLRLLDRYPLKVPFKGGFVQWVPKLIIITAPKSPQDMWNLRTKEDVAQLTRRITYEVPMPNKNLMIFQMLPWEFVRNPTETTMRSLECDEQINSPKPNPDEDVAIPETQYVPDSDEELFDPISDEQLAQWGWEQDCINQVNSILPDDIYKYDVMHQF